VLDWAGLQPDTRALDIGCGIGAAVIAAAPELPGGKATGVDPSRDFIVMARRRARHLDNVLFEVAAAERLPFDTGSFDVVWSVHSAHHWQDLGTGIGESRRVLRPGGRLLIVERHDTARPWGIGTDQAHAIADALTAAGFNDTAVDQRRVGRRYEFLIRGTSPCEPATQ
jgi:ubiquinone/menaquinone biosynthesis C-methylase UbiE